MYTIKNHYSKNKTLLDYPFGENVEVNDFFSIKCNIVIPATELVITTSNVENIDCDLIVEAANGPINPWEDRLNEKNTNYTRYICKHWRCYC